jgi:hypothetical protein
MNPIGRGRVSRKSPGALRAAATLAQRLREWLIEVEPAGTTPEWAPLASLLPSCLTFQPRYEEPVQARYLAGALALAATAACGPTKPRVYGSYNDFAPRVTPKIGERTPQHITIDLARPANVAVFLVVPGSASRLLFPADSTQSGFVQQGSREVETSLARTAAGDSARLARRPNGNQVPNPSNDPRQQQANMRTRGGFDPGANSFLNRGYLLVYASPDPLPYNTLNTRVNGVTIPIDDADALNTVTKLIRETTKTTGTWAAYATEFTP